MANINFSAYEHSFAGLVLALNNKTDKVNLGVEFYMQNDNFEWWTFNWKSESLVLGYLTGFYDPNNYWFEVISAGYTLNDKRVIRFAYPNGGANMSLYEPNSAEKQPNDGAVQMNINELLDNNKKIAENNIVCAGMLNELKRVGIQVPKQLIDNVFYLQHNLENRNNELKRTMSKVGNSFYNEKEFDSSNELQKFWNNYQSQIGLVLSTTAILIIAIVLVGLISSTLWLLYKRYYPESKVHLQLSNETLTDIYKYLPKESRDRLMKELANFEKTANRAIQDQKGLGTIKTLGIAAALFFGIPYLVKQFKD